MPFESAILIRALGLKNSRNPLSMVSVPAGPYTCVGCRRTHAECRACASPAPVDNGRDPAAGALSLPPPKSGTRIRFVDIPPDTPEFLRDGAAKMREAFEQIGDAAASTVATDSPHPLMHRTETVDFGVVIEGELTLVLDDSEVQLKPGSVVVQRGTNHAWANRSGRPCRMLFVLVDGSYDSTIRAALDKRRR